MVFVYRATNGQDGQDGVRWMKGSEWYAEKQDSPPDYRWCLLLESLRHVRKDEWGTHHGVCSYSTCASTVMTRSLEDGQRFIVFGQLDESDAGVCNLSHADAFIERFIELGQTCIPYSYRATAEGKEWRTTRHDHTDKCEERILL